MAQATVNRLTNANVYLDGKSLLGKAEEVNTPIIKQVMSEHKALGMFGKFELPAGIDKLEASIKWNSFYADTFKKIADGTKAYSLQIRSSLETHTSQGKTAEVPVVVYLTGQFKDTPLGNFKQQDNVELTTAINVTYCKLEINGEEIVEIDVLANIYKVAGVDVMANYRANLGI